MTRVHQALELYYKYMNPTSNNNRGGHWKKYKNSANISKTDHYFKSIRICAPAIFKEFSQLGGKYINLFLYGQKGRIQTGPIFHHHFWCQPHYLFIYIARIPEYNWTQLQSIQIQIRIWIQIHTNYKHNNNNNNNNNNNTCTERRRIRIRSRSERTPPSPYEQ